MPPDLAALRGKDVRFMQDAMRRYLLEDCRLEPDEGVCQANFRESQHALLFAEELQRRYDMSLYDITVTEPLDAFNGLHSIEVPGLAEKRPSVLRGDSVLLTCAQGRFIGYVHKVALESIEVSFHQSFLNQPPFQVKFDFSRGSLRFMHRAIDDL